jgi:hypothetical protein
VVETDSAPQPDDVAASVPDEIVARVEGEVEPPVTERVVIAVPTPHSEAIEVGLGAQVTQARLAASIMGLQEGSAAPSPKKPGLLKRFIRGAGSRLRHWQHKRHYGTVSPASNARIPSQFVAAQDANSESPIFHSMRQQDQTLQQDRPESQAAQAGFGRADLSHEEAQRLKQLQHVVPNSQVGQS